ncbi:MAG: hypothetical protein WKF89_13465 [Chitinophagaceae bacterium]
MRKHIIGYGLFCLLLVMVLIACKKSNSVKTKTKTELLSDSVWRFSTIGIDQNNDNLIDYPLPTAVLPVCEVDNLYTFNVDSTGILDQGKEKCNAATSQKTPFTWKFLKNETEISTSVNILPIFEGAAQIITLNETTFTLSKAITVLGVPTPLKIVAVMIH